MDYGVHLPLIDFEGTEFSLGYLLRFTERAEGLGFSAIAANTCDTGKISFRRLEKS